MKKRQGDIYLVDLNPIRGHEQAGLRPVLIMQNNELNKYLTTLIVVPLTTSTTLKNKLTAYFLPHNITGIKSDSAVLLFQIRTIDTSRFIKKIGEVPFREFLQIKERLRFIF